MGNVFMMKRKFSMVNDQLSIANGRKQRAYREELVGVHGDDEFSTSLVSINIAPLTGLRTGRGNAVGVVCL